VTTPFAAVQAAWRFLNNPRVTPGQLAGPLVECARVEAPKACQRWLLVAMDWCKLHFGGHGAKDDRVALAHRKDLGYDLLTALAIGDRDGSPIAPLCLELRADDGVHSTRTPRPFRPGSSLDGLAAVMDHVAGLGLGTTPTPTTTPPPTPPPVFVIDREADSVGHYRNWDAAGHRFLVRADDARLVLHDGRERLLGEVADGMNRDEGQLSRVVGPVTFKGRPAVQFAGETIVVLHRPARTHRVTDRRTRQAKHRNVAGTPLPLRLIVSEVRDARTGKVLARWLLLTNLPTAVDAATAARWYYWRWRIESYHKLLKGAGQQVEQWQQETAAALARRLLVAAMACVVVWRLARDDAPAAAPVRDLLVRLSGRQIKRGKGRPTFTEPALLAGLGVLIPMLELLRTHDLDDLRQMAEAALPGLLPIATPAAKREGG